MPVESHKTRADRVQQGDVVIIGGRPVPVVQVSSIKSGPTREVALNFGRHGLLRFRSHEELIVVRRES